MTESYTAWQIKNMSVEAVAKAIARQSPISIKRRKELNAEIKRLQEMLWDETYGNPTGRQNYLAEAKQMKLKAEKESPW